MTSSSVERKREEGKRKVVSVHRVRVNGGGTVTRQPDLEQILRRYWMK
jgi:hypothetical protein